MDGVAGTILGQIRATDKIALPAWRARNFVSLMARDDVRGGVQFDATIGTRTRRIVVRLKSDDTYSIELGRVSRKLEWVHLDEAHGVMAESLAERIDYFLGEGMV